MVKKSSVFIKTHGHHLTKVLDYLLKCRRFLQDSHFQRKKSALYVLYRIITNFLKIRPKTIILYHTIINSS